MDAAFVKVVMHLLVSDAGLLTWLSVRNVWVDNSDSTIHNLRFERGCSGDITLNAVNLLHGLEILKYRPLLNHHVLFIR